MEDDGVICDRFYQASSRGPNGAAYDIRPWQNPAIGISTGPAPELIYDYHKITASTYKLNWLVQGDQALAGRIGQKLDTHSRRSVVVMAFSKTLYEEYPYVTGLKCGGIPVGVTLWKTSRGQLQL